MTTAKDQPSDQPKESVKIEVGEKELMAGVRCCNLSRENRFASVDLAEFAKELAAIVAEETRAPHPATGEPATAKEIAEYALELEGKIKSLEVLDDNYILAYQKLRTDCDQWKAECEKAQKKLAEKRDWKNHVTHGE